MNYHLTLMKNYVREPDKFLKTAVNLLRTPFVDTFVVSWPKAGRTWLRVLLGRVLLKRGNHAERKLLDTYALTRTQNCDRVLFTHAGKFHLPDTRPIDGLRFKSSPYGRRKVVFVVRDIRDVLVSYYFQESRRTRVFKGDIHDFVRDDILGIRKIVAYTTLWFRNRHRPRQFHLVRYEDLHADAAAVLRGVLEFIGVKDVQDAQLQEAIEFAAFKNMKKLEASGKYSDSMLKARSSSDRESFKVRRGKMGGFVDYLDDSDLEFVDAAVAELGDPECDWYFPGTPTEAP